jgi:hypothetical protein
MRHMTISLVFMTDILFDIFFGCCDEMLGLIKPQNK